ncbi:MAG: hypothetical protein WBF06_03535 [Candidatus Acidiferrales bacterium]
MTDTPPRGPGARTSEKLSTQNISHTKRVLSDMTRTKHYVRLSLFVFSVAIFAHGQALPPTTRADVTPSVSPLWGDLAPGPYRVGFRSLFRFDTSRTWASTRDFKGTFSPDLSGRPVQINIWYPARTDAEAKQMHFGDYVDQLSPEAFSEFDSIMRDRNRQDVVGSVSHDQLAALQATPMNAFGAAPPAEGRFPAVLYFGGLDAQINSNVILCEYLASHGYIVASVSLLGPTNEQTFQSRTSEDLEASVRDMEFAWSVLAENPSTDRTRLAVMGHSVGAIEAVLFGMRNANVSAVIALDGTYAFPGLSTVLTHAYGYAPEKMRAAFLDLRRAQGAQGNDPLDLTTVESFRYSDRTFVTIEKMHHSDFTSFAMIGEQFHTPIAADYPLNGWNRETAKTGHEQACRIVLAFLDAKVRNDANALTTLSEAVQQADGGLLRHEEGTPAPPSPLESAALASQQGLGAVKALFVRICGERGVGTCIDGDRFNTWGYNLLGQNRPKDALAVFELAVWAHPRSANAQDSLADGYLAVGDKESARKAVIRAIELAPSDPSLDAGSEPSFLSEEHARLQQIQ